LKIAAIGDLHCSFNSEGKIRDMLRGAEECDALLLAGDLTDGGQPAEMEVLVAELSLFEMPIIAVPGNHDYEGSQIETVLAILEGGGVHVLDATSVRVGHVDFIGTKGFSGGFGKARVQPFGEPGLKQFVMTGIEEVMRLNKVLKESQGTVKVGLMHYAPIKQTLEGENPEIYAFLGSSLYGDVFDAYRVDVILHSHAHHGSPAGATAAQIPVYNVSRFVQRKMNGRDYLLLDV
jgi:uncharacterized protein